MKVQRSYPLGFSIWEKTSCTLFIISQTVLNMNGVVHNVTVRDTLILDYIYESEKCNDFKKIVKSG